MIRSLALLSVASLAVVACGTSTSNPDSFSTSSASATAAPACTSLSACCPRAADPQLCVAIVTGNVATECSTELASQEASGGCGSASTATGCTALAACCAKMTGTSQQGCLAIVAQAQATTCTTELSAFESLGSCGAMGTGPGTGTGTGTTTATTTRDAGTTGDTGTSGPVDATTGPGDAAGATTTIAKARTGNTTSAITVNAFVTALAGVPNDYPTWYIEDPAGGPSSGVAVYCDPLVSPACTVPEPSLHDLIQISGAISTYMGQAQFIPTAMKVLQSNATSPPVATLTAAECAPSASSPYRGVFVKLGFASRLTVDSVKPAALGDTACGANLTAAVPACTSLCEPPVYSGFQANDGAGNEVYFEAPFFHTDPLQSSPECLTQSGVVPVKVGTTFSAMSGILDFDGYASAQALSPVLPADYTTP